jgi:protein-S-isoprenylcysteine O-methyltransferase Ste14
VISLSKKAFLALLKFQVSLAVLLFLPAWSLRFWQAWLYWILFAVLMLSSTLYFLRHDPQLAQRRLEAAEPQRSQRLIMRIVILLYCAVMFLSGLDHRFHWSIVPNWLVLFSAFLVLLGFWIMFLALRENSYAASTVRVEREQPVISTGLYGFVRHPMYAGGILMIVATPSALGSLSGLATAVALFGVIVIRLLNEERYLSANLAGYDQYCRRVHCRLIPFVW